MEPVVALAFSLRRLPRPGLTRIAVVAAAATTLLASSASALWTTGGSGSGTVSAGTLDAASISVPASSTGSVVVTWDTQAEMTPASANSGVTYVVERKLGAGSFAAIGSGPCSGTLPRPTASCTDTVGVSGTYTYRVVAYYSTSWTATSNEDSVVVTVGTAPNPPTVDSTTPASPANNNSPHVLGTAEAGSTVNLYTNNTCTSAVAGTGTASGGNYDITVAVADDSTTTFYATAMNTFGTSNCSSSFVTYVEDSTAPSVTVNQKAGQADPTNALPILWTVAFSESVTGFDASDLTRGGTATGGTVSVSGAGASYEISLTGSPTNGTVSFTIAASTAQDPAGNTNSASTSTDNTVTYDTVAPPAPSVSSSSPQNNRVTLTFSDTEAGVTFECQFESTGWVACTSPYTFGPGSQYDGTHNYSVRAIDAAGNQSTATTVQQAA